MQQAGLDFSSIPALARFASHLENAGIDDQSSAFILGQVTREVINASIVKAGLEIGQEQLNGLSQLPTDEEKATALRQAYETKTGKNVDKLINECAELIVQDFEKQE